MAYSEFHSIANWFPTVFSTLPTVKSSLEIEHPSDYKLNIYTDSLLTITLDTLENGRTKHSWVYAYQPSIDREPLSPPVEALIPRVSVKPNTFNYTHHGSTASWADFGNWMSTLNADNLALTPS